MNKKILLVIFGILLSPTFASATIVIPADGGLGIDASGFATGSMPFFNGSVFDESSALNWDETNKLFKLGGEINLMPVLGDINRIKVSDQTISNTDGNHLLISAGKAKGTGEGGGIQLSGGETETGVTGGILIGGGASRAGTNQGGNVTIAGGGSIGGAASGDAYVVGGVSSVGTGNGGNVYIISGQGGSNDDGDTGNIFFALGSQLPSGDNGKFIFMPYGVNTGTYAGVVDFSLVDTSDKTFTFPNASGTLPLLQLDQEFSGTNVFSAESNYFVNGSSSTVHVGEDSHPGCIVMGDTDAAGVTYITTLNGVISASSTPPANCN